jgi:hypothetical protein
MLRQRDLNRGITKFHGLAALCNDDLLFWDAELLSHLGCKWCADDGRSGLLGYWTNVRNMIKVRVGDEDRFGLRYVRCLKAKWVASRRAVKIGVKEIDLIFISKFEIGVAEPPNDDNVRV